VKFYTTDRFKRTVAKLATELSAVRMRHALIGGNAVDVWTNPPVTKDIDLLVEFDQAKLMRFIDRMHARHPEVVLVQKRAIRRAGLYVLYYVDRTERVRLDVIMSDHAAFGWALEGAVRVPGVAVRIARPEDLVVTKFLAGRPKDVRAIRSILRGTVRRLTDWRYVGKALSLLGLLHAFNRRFKVNLSARGMERAR